MSHEHTAPIDPAESTGRSALFETDFRFLWPGQFVSQIGTAGSVVASGYLLKELTGSGSVLGVASFVTEALALCCLPFSGVFADRYDGKRIVLVCDAVCFAAALALAATLWVRAFTPATLVLAVIACEGVIACAAAFFRPAFGALVPRVVSRECLPAANAWYRTGARAGSLAGTLSGGGIYAALGAAWLFLIDSISYLFALACTSRIQSRPRERAARQTMSPRTVWPEFLEGARVLVAIPGAVWFLSMALVVNVFAAPIFVLLPFHAATFGPGAGTYAMLLATFSVGVLLGYAAAARWRSSGSGQSWRMTTALVAMCATFIVLARTRHLQVAMASMLVAGLANGYWSIIFEATLQADIPNEVLGRVLASFGVLAGALTPLGALVGGLVFDATGRSTAPLFTVCSTVMTLYPVMLLGNASYRRFFERLNTQADTPATGSAG